MIYGVIERITSDDFIAIISLCEISVVVAPPLGSQEFEERIGASSSKSVDNN